MNVFDADSRDPGLAAERTDLAWSRSGLSLLACGAAVMRGISQPPLTTGHRPVGACILALGVISLALGSWRNRRSRVRGARPATAADLAPITLGVAVVGLAAFVLAAFVPA